MRHRVEARGVVTLRSSRSDGEELLVASQGDGHDPVVGEPPCPERWGRCLPRVSRDVKRGDILYEML